MASELKKITIPAVGEHKATFIFMHGLGDTGHGWSSLAENFRLRRRFNHCAFVFPHAPIQPVTCNFGMKMTSWYDIPEFADMLEKEDEPGLLASVGKINRLISDEIEKGVEPENIIVGGFSQGGVIALLTGITSERKLGGIVGMSCYMPLRNKIHNMITDRSKEIPIFMGHGKEDRVVRLEWADMSQKKLKELGYKVEWNTYEGLDHSADTVELGDLEEWLVARIGAQ